MRKLLTLLLLLMLLLTSSAMAAEKSAYRLADEQGTLLAWLDVPPAVGDAIGAWSSPISTALMRVEPNSMPSTAFPSAIYAAIVS